MFNSHSRYTMYESKFKTKVWGMSNNSPGVSPTPIPNPITNLGHPQDQSLAILDKREKSIMSHNIYYVCVHQLSKLMTLCIDAQIRLCWVNCVCVLLAHDHTEDHFNDNVHYRWRYYIYSHVFTHINFMCLQKHFKWTCISKAPCNLNIP